MGDYVDANGVRTYYETTGKGDPLVLLHGGMASARSWFGQVPTLSQHYRVITPERRGHGRTADVDGPITYEVMAADTVAFLDAVGTGPAHLLGWSDGAVVAVMVALHRPDLVRKLVLVGQYYSLDGAVEGATAALTDHREGFEAMVREEYAALSPDGPEHLAVVLDKVMRMWRQEPDISLETLADLQAPTLQMQGDQDIVTVEYSAAFVRALPTAQLAVVPGASHGLPLEKPDLVNRLVLDFLADDQQPLMMVAE